MFLAGIDSMIQWEGIPQDDRVKIEYTPDSGKTWNFVTDNAKGGKHVWLYPPLPRTSLGMIRVLQMASDGIDPNMWSSGYEPGSISSRNSPDGSKIAYLQSDNSLSIRISHSGEQLRIFRKIPGRITSYCWDYSSNFLAIGFEDGLLIIKDIRSGNNIREIRNSGSSINVISWNQSGNKIATSNTDGVLAVIETSTGIEIQKNRDIILL